MKVKLDLKPKGVGMIKIYGYRKDKIRKCIELLHEDYNNMKLDIIIFESKTLQILWCLISLLFGIFLIVGKKYYHFYDDDKDVFGFYCDKVKTIVIYAYMFDSSSRDVEVVNTLYHELRHAYQYNYKLQKYEDEFEDYNDLDSDVYSHQRCERDANMFSARMCNKFHKEISDIFWVNYHWHCDFNLGV